MSTCLQNIQVMVPKIRRSIIQYNPHLESRFSAIWCKLSPFLRSKKHLVQFPDEALKCFLLHLPPHTGPVVAGRTHEPLHVCSLCGHSLVRQCNPTPAA